MWVDTYKSFTMSIQQRRELTENETLFSGILNRLLIFQLGLIGCGNDRKYDAIS